MKFVSGSHKQARAQDTEIQNWYRPLEIRHQSRRAKQEQAQNGVLAHVRTLPKNEVNRRKRLRRNVGFEPAQKRDNESRCVLGGHQIGRAEENHAHPDDHRQPVL